MLYELFADQHTCHAAATAEQALTYLSVEKIKESLLSDLDFLPGSLLSLFLKPMQKENTVACNKAVEQTVNVGIALSPEFPYLAFQVPD